MANRGKRPALKGAIGRGGRGNQPKPKKGAGGGDVWNQDLANRAETVVKAVASGNAIWMSYLATAAKMGWDTFNETLQKKNPIEVGFDNGILQAVVKGWAAAVASSYDSLPKTVQTPLEEILAPQKHGK